MLGGHRPDRYPTAWRAPGGRTATIARAVALPLKPPIEPQLARSGTELPVGEQWAYEPKYDGFRAIAFVDGDECHDPVARGQAARPLLPRAGVPARPLRDRRRDRDRRRRRPARTSARCSSGSIPRSRGSRCWPSRRRRATSPSTCWRCDDESLLELPFAERRARARGSSPGDGHRAHAADPRPRRHRSRGCATARAWWPRSSARPTARASARGWSRSSGCGRSTRWSSATGRARRRGRSAR